MLSAIRVCSKLRPTVFRTLSTNVKGYQSANRITVYQSKVLTPVTLTKIHCRLIHVSSPKNTPKLLILFIRPLLSVISGKLFRRWWQRQPIEKRSKLMAAFKRHRHKIWAVFGAYLASVLIYWVCNMKEVPITRRVRFMSFDSDEISDLTEEAAKAMVQENVILELSHPAVQRVLKTAKRIIAANNDIERMKEMEWTVSMVDVPGMINAMVTGKGQIIIFKDIVDACATDDELGIILAHEMSHAILDHVPEKISNTYLVGFFTAPILFLIWALLPSDLWAAVFHFLYHNATSFAISLPYSRMLEEEADAVGLQLAARACIDVRQAVSFWKRMDYKQKVDTGFLGDEGIPKSLEYFSTHPTHESRWRKMETILEEALVLRDQCQCPALGPLPKDFGLRFVKEEGEKAAHIRILL